MTMMSMAASSIASTNRLEQMIVDAHHRARVKLVWKDRPTAFALELTRAAGEVFAAMREQGWTVKIASVLERTPLVHELSAERVEGKCVLRVWASMVGGEKPWSVHARSECRNTRVGRDLYSEQVTVIDVRDAVLMAVAAAMEQRADEGGAGVDVKA